MIYPGFWKPKDGKTYNVFGLGCMLFPEVTTAYRHKKEGRSEGWYHHSMCRMTLVFCYWDKKEKLT